MQREGDKVKRPRSAHGSLRVVGVVGITVGLLLVAGIAVGVLLVRGTDDAAGQGPGPAGSPFTTETAGALTAALRSGDAKRIDDVVVLPPGTAAPERFVEQMSGLADLTFDPATFVDRGDGTAEVQTTATGPQGTITTWTAHLVLIGDQWKIAATVAAP